MFVYVYIIAIGPIGIQLMSNNKQRGDTANLRTNIMYFRGFDSSRILVLRGGSPRPIGNSQEIISQHILVGIILVGRLGALHFGRWSGVM